MQFTPEHEQIADTVRKFVAKEINPFVAEWQLNFKIEFLSA